MIKKFQVSRGGQLSDCYLYKNALTDKSIVSKKMKSKQIVNLIKKIKNHTILQTTLKLLINFFICINIFLHIHEGDYKKSKSVTDAVQLPIAIDNMFLPIKNLKELFEIKDRKLY